MLSALMNRTSAPSFRAGPFPGEPPPVCLAKVFALTWDTLHSHLNQRPPLGIV